MADMPFYQTAKTVGVSETTLRKLFHQHLRMAPMTYITSIKLAKARSMLCTTNHSITTLAEMVGYANASKMSIAFRKQYGYSPSQCRKMWKENRFGVDNLTEI